MISLCIFVSNSNNAIISIKLFKNFNKIINGRNFSNHPKDKSSEKCIKFLTI